MAKLDFYKKVRLPQQHGQKTEVSGGPLTKEDCLYVENKGYLARRWGQYMDFICCCNDTAIYKNSPVQNLATNSLELKQLKRPIFQVTHFKR